MAVLTSSHEFGPPPWDAEHLRQFLTEWVAEFLTDQGLAHTSPHAAFQKWLARRVLFTNPARPLTGRAVQPPPVLPLDDTRRTRLLGDLDEPAERLIALLAGVHALRPSRSAP